MKQLLERYPFFLILLPAFIVIHFEKELHNVISYKFVYERIFIFFTSPFLLFLIIFLLTRSLKKSALSAFILSLILFYTGDIKNWLSLNFPESIIHSYRFLLSFILVVSITSCYLIKRSISDFRKQFLVINTGLLLFIAADIISIVFKLDINKYKLVNETGLNLQPCASCEKPDIYYIVFDTYTSSDILKTKFTYSNKFIEEDLKNKGFYIAGNSKSNYSLTAFSIGSTLNMNYIKNADTSSSVLFDRDYLPAINLVSENRTFSYLKKEGYDFFNHSIFHIKEFPSTVNKYDNWRIRHLFDQFNLVLKMRQDLSYHLPEWIQNKIWSTRHSITDPSNRHAHDSLVKTHLLESVNANSIKPKFVYAHFLKPHPPYSYDSLGIFINTRLLSNEKVYAHQIAYCNRIIKEVTDSILATAKKPLVIIIQGDHGTEISGENEPDKKLSVFNSIYFSNKDYSSFNDSLTNVNTFRILLNTFFQKELPLLPNEFYVFKN